MEDLITHSLPSEIRAGDSVSWTVSASDYPASGGGTLAVHFVSASGRISVTGTPEGDDYALAMTAVESAQLPAGRVAWVAVWTSGDERKTLGDSWVEVLPDLAGAGASAGLDTRSVDRQLLDLVNAALLGNLSSVQAKKQISTSEGSMAIELVPRTELMQIRDQLEARVKDEDDLERMKDGKTPSSVVHGRISR